MEYYDFLLAIHCNYGPILDRFCDADIFVKIANCSRPPLFNVHIEGGTVDILQFTTVLVRGGTG